MENILIIGAGKSTTYLIDYLLETAIQKKRKVTVADLASSLVKEKLNRHPAGFFKSIDLDDEQNRKQLIQEASVVISMLPASLHPVIAKDCLELGKHFFTASYESAELRLYHKEIEEKGLLFLNECGLDPGIDHMSAMKIIDELTYKGYKILSFKSFTGGLIDAASEDNPWKYKFTWNPRNVVLAGQGTAKYLENNEYKYIPYHKLFERIEKIYLNGYGTFEGYANRDSLIYRDVYQLQNTPTLLRGTLRKEGFCPAWNVFVQLGMTDDNYTLEFNGPANTKYGFLNSFLPYHPTQTTQEKLSSYLPWVDADIFEKLDYLGLFGNEPLPIRIGSPAVILQSILEPKWLLKDSDKDLIVMQHIFEVESPAGIKVLRSSLVHTGENQTYTAMAKTVGLPLAIAVDLFLDGKITCKGLQRPTLPEIYLPILEKLESFGITFLEEVHD